MANFEGSGSVSVISITIAHNMITELIPKPFRFGNSFTEITEDNSQNISVGIR